MPSMARPSDHAAFKLACISQMLRALHNAPFAPRFHPLPHRNCAACAPDATGGSWAAGFRSVKVELTVEHAVSYGDRLGEGRRGTGSD